MAIELRWLVSQSTCCLHTADLLRRGVSLADRRLADLLVEPTAGLVKEIDFSVLPEERYWRVLIALSVGVEDNRQLAEISLRKAIGGERVAGLIAPLAGRITELEKAAQLGFGEMVEQTATRSEWLRGQWAMYGPSLLHQVGVESEPALLAERADVSVVWPSAGGGGGSHLEFNSVRIEAVEQDAEAQLPEWLRLAWLLSQLNADLPMYGEMIHRDRLPLVAGLAMLPLCLNAAASLALEVPWEAPVDEKWIGRAIDAWQVAAGAPAELNETLVDWWYSYYESRPRWNVALQALDRMLLETEAAGRAQHA